MKHAVTISIALFSLTFLTGGSCDSGDFTTTYSFCCDSTGLNCTSNSAQCPANGCSTGQQSFVNGQNECGILQTDTANNNCALFSRFQWYITIGCTGSFTETPAYTAPVLVSAAPGPTGSGTITLTWAAPVPPYPTVAIAPSSGLTYTILEGVVTGGEGFYTSQVSGNTSLVTGLVSNATYFFTVAASLSFEGTFAAPSVVSNELSAVAP